MTLLFEVTAVTPNHGSPFRTMAQPTDFFSKFVNWLSAQGTAPKTITNNDGGKDFFSKLMNRISS
ncbi:MAG: ferredoxin--nitrite reductase [Synechococcus sp.]|uniref:ferredoxin--nitrite reductase n=1 Tax=unclassified Synechococcus TaxID=2626047 RepID=UPI0018615B93|nr:MULTISPECIES: ferredoxin--nitrite reductase [unclassified Synechococcus]QNI69121.1 hypothetical protein SynBMKMC1_03084 [Synechococcus sp. BMK-MC-1]